MEKKISRSQVAKLVMASDISEEQKQKMLFALPKMNAQAIQELHDELLAVKKMSHAKVHQRIEKELAKEQQFEKLHQSMGIDSQETDEDAILIDEAFLADIGDDTDKMNAFLMSLGPKGIKKLEKAIQRMAADPSHDFTQAEIDETVGQLRDYSAEIYLTAESVEEEFRKEQLQEQIRAEDEKIAALEEMINELEEIAKSNK